MTRTIEKGFFKDYFIDLIEPMYEEVEKGKEAFSKVLPSLDIAG